MALEGTLRDMSLSDLFQVFRMGPKTGVLLLNAGAERGIIYVAQGRLIDAALVRATDRAVLAVREEAVVRMLLWDAAAFVFRHDPAVLRRQVRITRDAEPLVIEGIRRRDNPGGAIPYQRITLETRLQLSPLPSSAESGVSLDVDQWRILSQVSSSPNLHAICAATGLSPRQVLRTVVELLAIGLVEVAVSPAAQMAGPPTPRHAQQATYSAAREPGVPISAAQLGGATASERPQMSRSLIAALMRRVRGL